MTLPVFLAPSLDGVAPGGALRLEGDEARHAVVRRVRDGERVAVTDGRGRRAECVVTGSTKSALDLAVASVEKAPREGPLVTVVQALPKGDRGELAVEVLTEVGADVLVPWAAERCVAVWRGERADKGLARWGSTAREAAKQARRAWHPEVRPVATTDEVARMVAAADVALVLHEEASEPLAAVDLTDLGGGGVLLVVGPEGGLAPAELETLAAAGAHVVRLGSSVLRTSTAGVVAVGAVLARTRWR